MASATERSLLLCHQPVSANPTPSVRHHRRLWARRLQWDQGAGLENEAETVRSGSCSIQRGRKMRKRPSAASSSRNGRNMRRRSRCRCRSRNNRNHHENGIHGTQGTQGTHEMREMRDMCGTHGTPETPDAADLQKTRRRTIRLDLRSGVDSKPPSHNVGVQGMGDWRRELVLTARYAEGSTLLLVKLTMQDTPYLWFWRLR